MNNLIKTPETSIASRITAIHALHDKIAEWRRNVPACLQLTPSSLAGIALDVLPKLLLIHTVYHQSLTALHASIVPFFSWSPGDDTWLPARQMSAQIAFDHACAASNLFDATLAHFPRLSALPSFVGYAAYCGCAIQIPFLWCAEEAIRQTAQKNVRTNMRIIELLSQYWKFSSVLVCHLQ